MNESLEARLKRHAHFLGFDLAGIARADAADGFPRFQSWLHQGFAGQMHYMHRHEQARKHPSSILSEVRSVVMVGINHAVTQDSQASGGCKPAVDNPTHRGKVARYAWCKDYHDIIRHKLKQLLAWVREQIPDCHGRAVVDTAPLLERDFARRAGLGWHGKNTMLINKQQGSYFFLGGLLLDIELTPDLAHETSHCGTCTACLNACPTDAFVEPGVLDSRKCISYLTIELREKIPENLRTGMGGWLFGCDVCQEVCPWNRKAPGTRDECMTPREDLVEPDLIQLLEMSEEEFQKHFQGTALSRPRRAGLLRNAAIVLGNVGDESALSALEKAVQDEEPMISEAAQWAIEQIQSRC